MPPLVSFIVPNYNYGCFLKECLDSIFSQNLSIPFEVIVIEDGSSDDSIGVLNQYRDPRLKVIIHEQNEGYISTFNEGFALSCGKYVCRIDPDDRYHSSFLSEALPILEKNPKIGMVHANVSLINGQGQVTVPEDISPGTYGSAPGNFFLPLLQKNFICAPTTMVRRKAWVNAFPVPSYLSHSDWYLSLKVARHYDIQHIPKVLADYRVHSRNHHTLITYNQSEEPSTFKILEEWLPQLSFFERRKVLGCQYLELAIKYFGIGYYFDSRRCFLNAFWNAPHELFSLRNLRLFFATLMPRAYQWVKQMISFQPH